MCTVLLQLGDVVTPSLFHPHVPSLLHPNSLGPGAFLLPLLLALQILSSP